MLRKNRNTYLCLILAIFFFQSCASTTRLSGVTISPPVPGKGIDLISPDPIQSIGVAKSGSFSGDLKVYSADPREIIALRAVEGAAGGVQVTIGFALATGGVGIVAAPILIPFGMIMNSIEGLPVSEEDAEQLRFLGEEVVGYTSVQEELALAVTSQSQGLTSTRLETFDLTCIPEYDCESDFWVNLDFDAVLEIQVVVVGLAATGDDTRPLQFVIDGWSKLIRVSDKKVIRTRPFSIRGIPEKKAYWLDGNRNQLATDYHVYINNLANRIVETMIVLPDTVPVYDSSYCWAKPLEPEDTSPFGSYIYTTTPVMRWTPLSRRAKHKLAGSDTPIYITDVTYDFKIWLNKGGLWPIYEQTGLSEPEHVVTKPLSKNRTYYWSVKASFLENGVPRRTNWSHHINKKMPPGWRSQKRGEEEAVWPPEWNFTSDDKKKLSEGLLNRLICVSEPVLPNKLFMFKVR